MEKKNYSMILSIITCLGLVSVSKNAHQKPIDILSFTQNPSLSLQHLLSDNQTNMEKYTIAEIHFQECSSTIEDDDDICRDVDMGKRCMKMLEMGYMADLTIKVQDKTFRCHKNIIGFCSPELAALIHKNPEILTLKDINKHLFEILLQIIYSGETDKLENVEDTLAVGRTAYDFHVYAAVAFCTKILRNVLNATSVLETLEFACLVGDDDLKAACTKFIQEHTDAVLRSDSFIHCNVATLELILSQEIVHAVTELDLFLACARWVEKKKKPRQALGSALNLIRFRFLTAKEFATKVVPNKLLTAEEERLILLNIATENDEMPGGFSYLKNKRHLFLSDEEMSKIQVGSGKDVWLELTDKDDYLTSEPIAGPPVKFSVNADMNLIGVKYLSAHENKIGGKYTEDVTVTLKLANGAEIASTKFRGEVEYGYVFDVRFPHPVPIYADITYALHCTNNVPGVRQCTWQRKQKTYKTKTNLEIRVLEEVFSPISFLNIAPNRQ